MTVHVFNTCGPSVSISVYGGLPRAATAPHAPAGAGRAVEQPNDQPGEPPAERRRHRRYGGALAGAPEAFDALCRPGPGAATTASLISSPTS